MAATIVRVKSLLIVIKTHCNWQLIIIAEPLLSQISVQAFTDFQKKEAAAIAVSTVLHFLSHTDFIEKVFFVCFDEENYELMDEKIKSKSSWEDKL